MNQKPRVEITPRTCSGQPRVAGTRIRVSNIVLWTEQGQSPDEIIAGYPQLTLAGVHSALAFYFDNREEMDKLIADDEAFAASLQRVHQALGKQAGADSVSP